MYGTNLYAEYPKGTNVPWYCPKSMDDELLWIRTRFVLPPFLNCIAKLTQARFDNKTGRVSNLPNVTIRVHDFGNERSIDFVIKNQKKYKKIAKYHLDDKHNRFLTYFDNMHTIINYFVDHGYQVGQNLTIAPYDWRMAPQYVDDFWPQLRKLIEETYDKNQHQRVTLFGYSMGGMMIQQFLSSDQAYLKYHNKIINGRPILLSVKDPKNIPNLEWKEKYIEKVILLAPSIGGSYKCFDGMILRFSPLIPKIRNRYIADMSTSLPGFHSHFPNFAIFNDTSIVRGPNGTNYSAKQLPDLVRRFSHMNDNHLPIMDRGIDIQREAPLDIGNIALAIIYNSKLPTLSFLDYTQGWNHDPVKYFEGDGDGTVQAEGPRYACNNWKHENQTLLCIDLEEKNKKLGTHAKLTVNPDVLDLFYNLTTGNFGGHMREWWIQNKTAHITMSQVRDSMAI